MGPKHSTRLQTDLANEFYQACSNGHVNNVRELLPILSYDEVNYIDPTRGHTSLHAACLNNHHEIVRLLLENNVCSRTILNQDNKTAYELTDLTTIRSLFNRPRHQNGMNRFINTRKNTSSFGLITNNKSLSTRPDNWVTGYFSYADARDAQLMLALSHASPIMKLLLHTRTEHESKKIVQRLIETYIPITHIQYQRAQKLYQEYLDKKSVEPLLTLYSLDTPFYIALQSNADAYTVILYLYLQKLSHRAFRGSTYRGMIVSSADLTAYQWAHEHAAIVETRVLQSTSRDRAVADMFADLPYNDGDQISVIIRYKFIQSCPTAIHLDNISHFGPDEAEVLLLPFTLFKVVSIKEYNINTIQRYEITMQNVPAIQNSLWASSRKRDKKK